MYPYREMFYNLDAEVSKAIKILQNAQKKASKIYYENSDPSVDDESNLPNEEEYNKKLKKIKIKNVQP